MTMLVFAGKGKCMLLSRDIPQMGLLKDIQETMLRRFYSLMDISLLFLKFDKLCEATSGSRAER